MDLFGTDGIRDLAGQGRLTPEGVARTGRALASFARARGPASPRVALGRDTRPSGPVLLLRLGCALAEGGCRVVDLGVVPTPAVAWTVSSERLDLGVVVSASHNPAAYNGLKVFVKGGRKLEESEEREIEALHDRVSGDEPHGERPALAEGARRYATATADWLGHAGRLEGRHLVVDVAAGAADATAAPVLRALGARVTLLHTAGSRPINEACGTESRDAWRQAVRDAGADGGIAFDGDADRVLLADREGAVLDGDDALAILAEDADARGALPGGLVVGTIMTGLGLEERLRTLGVRLERTPVGDRHVARRMRETGAPFGAEPSGHVVLEREGALIGDGLVAGVRVLQAAARLGKDLATLRRATPHYPQVRGSVPVGERRDLGRWPELEAALADVRKRFGERIRVVVRYSGTEPLLRLMAEGPDESEVRAAFAALLGAVSVASTAS